MATAEQNQAVDLFGNPTSTPRELMQQQLAALMQDTAARTAGADPRTQGVSKMGAAAGALINNVLMSKGVIPMSPEMERSKKLQAARDATQKAAAEQGIDPIKNPGEFADLAASHFLRAGDEKAALMAIQFRQLQEANTRVAEKERLAMNAAQTSEAKDLSVFTPESRKAFVDGGRKDPSVLALDPNAAGGNRGEYYVPVETANGVVGFDTRRSRFVDPVTGKPIQGNPVVKSSSDPALQRRLAANKKAGELAGEETLDGKIDAIESVQSAQDMLDKGIYAGTYAELQLAVKKALPGDKKRVENTEQFITHIGNTVIPRLKEFGGNDSNEELKYLEKVMGGSVKMEEATLRKILESSERKISRGLSRARKRAKEAGLPSDQPTNDAGKHGALDANGIPTVPGNPTVDDLLKKYGQ